MSVYLHLLGGDRKRIEGLQLKRVNKLMRMTLIPWLVFCCLHFTFIALSIITQAVYHFSLLYLPMCCLGWNLILRSSICNVLNITKPIYLCGHIHIFIHSHSHQSLHRETLNQDSPFKQTNELWITPLHKLPAQSVTKTERLGGWQKGGKNERGDEKHSVDKSRSGRRGDRECETESNREEDTQRREGEKQRGKRECVALEGLWSRKRPLLYGSTLMGLARPRFVHTVRQSHRIKITK